MGAAESPSRRTRDRDIALVVLALASFCVIYAAEFWYDGGRSYVSPDGRQYLAMASHQPGSPPYSLRLLQPALARACAWVFQMSPLTAFQLLAPLELLASLAILAALLRRQTAPLGWQLSVLIAFGAALAVSFGPRPVLVDPLVLLLVCAMLLALQRGQIAMALVVACLAALTKEYGAILGFAWAAHAFQRGRKWRAVLGAVVPGLLVLTVQFLSSTGHAPSPILASDPFTYSGHLHAALVYEWRSLRTNGFLSIAILYTWIWAAMWPALVLSIPDAVRSVRRRDAGALACAIVMLCIPLLVVSDWDRTLIVVVPFACLVAARHPLARDWRLNWPVVVGGISAAAARLCLVTSLSIPHGLIRSALLISLIATAAIGVLLLRPRRVPTRA